MKKSILFLSFVTMLLLVGCDSSPIKPDIQPDTPEEPFIRNGGIVDRIFDRKDPAPLVLAPSSNQQGYSQMGAKFAQNLFNKLCLQADPGTNVCISPLSLEIALGMLANGVEPEARKEMLDIIAGEGITADSLNVWYHKLRDALEATNCVRLANAMWAQKDYYINPDFIETNQTFYDAEVGNLDFTKTQEAYDSICQWAYDHTFGNIRELNLPINAGTDYVLANATWFGANWMTPFDKESTIEAIFTKTNGTEQTVNMMNAQEEFLYQELLTYQIIELPFGVFEKKSYPNGYERDICTDQPFSMFIALPKAGYTPNDILADIDWNVTGKHLSGDIHLPKFNFKTSNELIDRIKELGILKLFTSGAMSGINERLSIDFINQDVSVKIDEEGAEMAAVTVIGNRNGESTPKFDFNANHPFVFCVRDNVSHNILFIGKVENIE